MKILVTGGAGFIGSHVVDLYIEHGMEVVVVDDLSTGRLSNLNPGAKFYQLDIRSPELERIFARERPQIVNHHAAQMDVRKSVVEPIFDADVNIGGSLNLLECARRFEVERFIYISTGGAVYGEPEYLPCDEDHPINPVCQYGASKHTVEHYLYMYRENYDLDYVVLRYPNVYGPRQDLHGEAGVVAIFTGQMLAGERVVINGDGEQERDFVFISDIARANVLALVNHEARGIYNLGSGHGTSVNQVFEELEAITDYARPPEYGPAKLGETRRIYLSAARAQHDLGWRPKTSLQDGLKATVTAVRRESGPQPALVNSPPAARAPSLFARLADKEEVVRYAGLPHNDARVQALYAVGEGLAVREGFLARLLETAAEAVRAASGSAFLLDGGGRLREASVIESGKLWAVSEAMECLRGTYAKGLSGWAVIHRRAVLVSDTTRDGRWVRQKWETTPRSALCVPLVTGGPMIGALTLCAAGADAFSAADLALLVTIAGMLSLNGQLRVDSSEAPAMIADRPLTRPRQEAPQ